MKAILVLTTVPDEKAAKSLAQRLVKMRAAACVTITKDVTSFYRWKGKLEKAKEFFMLIKTAAKNFAEVKRIIESSHPYEVPEIISVPIVGGSSRYLTWLFQSLR